MQIRCVLRDYLKAVCENALDRKFQIFKIISNNRWLLLTTTGTYRLVSGGIFDGDIFITFLKLKPNLRHNPFLDKINKQKKDEECPTCSALADIKMPKQFVISCLWTILVLVAFLLSRFDWCFMGIIGFSIINLEDMFEVRLPLHTTQIRIKSSSSSKY
uniref:Uncharacterized protein n=1 Tax=Glossina pallidipes TaxID=7398 RepID=A0A1A9ZI95_GLOPL